MSKYVVDGNAHTLRFDFLVEGQAVEPTSAKYNVLKNDNTVVTSLSNQVITLSPGKTYANISVPGASNEATLVNELRYVNVEFIYQGKTYHTSQYYFLVENVNFPLSPDDVRAVLGVSAAEVPDSYIDILGAYNQVKAMVEVNTDTILQTGSALLPTLVQAVKYRAALTNAITIETSMFQSEQADNTMYTRFQKIDFAGLRNELLSRYNEALLKLDQIVDGGTGTVVYAIVAVGTDPVTGL